MEESSPGRVGPGTVQAGDEVQLAVSTSPTPARTNVAVLLGSIAGWMLLVALIYAIPALGAALAVALFVVVVPWGGTSASTRLVSTVVLGAGLLGLMLALGDSLGFRVLTLIRLQAAFVLPATAAAAVVVNCTLRRRPIALARPDASLAPLMLTIAATWWAVGYPARGADLGQTVGGLMLMGWDHQSHFTIFSYLQEQSGVWRQASPETASMFFDYPPLAGAIGVALSAFVGTPNMDSSRLVAHYVQTSGAMFGLGAGLFAWTAARAGQGAIAATLQRVRAGTVALVSGLVVGGYIVLGPAQAFFDYGFTNFFLAIALAAATSWLVIAELEESALQATILAVAATIAMGLLWTPLVLLMVPAGAVLLIGIVRRKLWWTLGLAVMLAAVGMWVCAWQVYRIVPSGPAADSIAQTLAAAGGGQPAVPVPHLVLLIALGSGVLAFNRSRPAASGWAPWAVPLAGIAITVAFVVNSVRAGFPPLDSYYVAKALWIVYLSLLPLLGTLVAVSFLAVLGDPTRRHEEDEASPRRSRLKTGTIGVVALATLWLSTPTENAPNGYIDYYALPVGGQAVLDRWTAFRDVPQGDVVARALEGTDDRPRSMVVVWDGGDLLTNRWLASLRGDLTLEADAVYTSLAAAPYGEPARAALEQVLVAKPNLDVVIVIGTSPSREVLRPLRQRYPDQVTLRQI